MVPTEGTTTTAFPRFAAPPQHHAAQATIQSGILGRGRRSGHSQSLHRHGGLIVHFIPPGYIVVAPVTQRRSEYKLKSWADKQRIQHPPQWKDPTTAGGHWLTAIVANTPAGRPDAGARRVAGMHPGLFGLLP
jgi:hypothetical protein